ncbi:MAG: hypothetical protein BAJALOKI1v1_1630001, partial [Promethearchaeota archaeon]
MTRSKKDGNLIKVFLSSKFFIYLMIKKDFKNIIEIWRTIFATMICGRIIPLLSITIRCPDCGSNNVGLNGTKRSGKRRVEGFICKSPACLKERHTNRFKKARQFIVTSSREFQELLWGKLKVLYEDLLKDGAKNRTIAKKYGI